MADRRINLTIDISTKTFQRNGLLTTARSTLTTCSGAEAVALVIEMLEKVVRIDTEIAEKRAELDALAEQANPIPAAYR